MSKFVRLDRLLPLLLTVRSPQQCRHGGRAAHDNIADINELWSCAILTTGHRRENNISFIGAFLSAYEFPDRSAN